MVAPKFATTEMEATRALVTMATHLLQTTEHALVNIIISLQLLDVITHSLQLPLEFHVALIFLLHINFHLEMKLIILRVHSAGARINIYYASMKRGS